MKAIWKKINLNYEKLNVFQAAIGLLFVVVTFSTYAGIMYSYSTSQAILQGFDEDSSYGVETSIKTLWINHNSSVNYGPLYYRLAAPLRHFVNSDLLAKDLSEQEAKFRNVHFHMLLMNLIAIFATGFLIMWILTNSWTWICLGTSVLPGLILANSYRSGFLFLAHPEHFVALLVAMAVLQLARWSEDSENSDKLWIGSLVWALASLTKLITMLFGPAILYFLWSVNSKNFRKNLIFFAKWVMIFYFLIGFPQSWDVLGYVKKLYVQNSYASLVDWEFLTKKWLPLFGNDYWRPIAFIFAISFLLPDTKARYSAATLKRLFIFVSLSTLMILAKKTTTPFEYYTFSFVNAGLVVFAIFMSNLQNQFSLQIKFLQKVKKSLWTPVGFFIFYPMVFNVFPKTIENNYNGGMICRTEAEAVRKIIGTKVKEGKKILTDPYMPYDRIIPRDQIDSPWDMSMDLLIKGNFQVVALKASYYQIFLEPNAPKVLWMKDKTPAIEFYKMFSGKSTLIDTQNRQWNKIYQDPCSFEIWERL